MNNDTESQQNNWRNNLPADDLLAKLIARFTALSLEPTWEDIADVVWLAAHRSASASDKEEAADNLVGKAISESPSQQEDQQPDASTQVEVAQPQNDTDTDTTNISPASTTTNTAAITTAPSSSDYKPGQLFVNEPGSGSRQYGLPLAVPTAPALPGALEMSRSLRPLMHRVPSRHRFVLDEEATIRRVTEQGIWVPVRRPAPARWFEIALVIDTATTMAAWEPTLREWQLLLERQGAFHDVRVWRMHTQAIWKPNPASAKTTLALYTAGQQTAYRPETLIDPTQRRLIVVATDCVSPVWHGARTNSEDGSEIADFREGAAWKLLELWGRHHPTAILQMLPQSLWRQTGLASCRRTRVRATQAGALNFDLREEDPQAWLRDPDTANTAEMPFPMMTLEPDALRAWARLVTNAGDASCVACVPPAKGNSRPQRSQRPPASPQEEARIRLRQFRALASPTALQLAHLFTVAPLRLPIMRLVQRVMLPTSRQLHLAEVLLGGILRRVEGKEGNARQADANNLVFEFYPHIQDILQDELPTATQVQVFNAISEYVSQQMGQGVDFQALLAAPQGPGTIALRDTDQAFAAIAPRILKRLGPRYAEAANVLAQTTVPVRQTMALSTHGEVVYDIVWSPDGQWLVVATQAGNLHFYPVFSPYGVAENASLPLPVQPPLYTLAVSRFGINQVSFSPTGEFLAAACYDHTTYIVSFREASNLGQGAIVIQRLGHGSEVRATAWSPDGSLLADGTQSGNIHLWNTEDWSRVHIEQLDLPISALAWSLAGVRVAFGREDGLFGFVERSGRHHWQEDAYATKVAVLSLAYTRDGRSVIVGRRNGALEVHEGGTGLLQTRLLSPHKQAIHNLSFSSDGRLMACKSTDGSVTLWNAQTWERVYAIDEPTGKEPGAGSVFHPSLPLLATLENGEAGVRLWSLDINALAPATHSGDEDSAANGFLPPETASAPIADIDAAMGDQNAVPDDTLNAAEANVSPPAPEAASAIPEAIDIQATVARDVVQESVRNEASFGSVSSLIYDAREQLRGQAGVHALIVGVSDYPHLEGGNGESALQNYGMGQLTSSARSAWAIAQWLIERKEHLAAPLATVRVLLSPSTQEAEELTAGYGVPATLNNFTQATYDWREDAAVNADGVTLFYFAGHGVQQTPSETVLLFPEFGKPHTFLLHAGVNIRNITTGMAPSPRFEDVARKQLYFIDASHTTLGQEFANAFATAIFDPVPTAREERQIVLINTAEPGQDAFAYVNIRTLFCEALLQCLNQDGAIRQEMESRNKSESASSASLVVTAHSLYQALNLYFAKFNRRENIRQNVTFENTGADFVIHHLDGSPAHSSQ